VANNVTTILGRMVPNGFQQIASVAASTGLTPPDRSHIALIQPSGGDVRWRDDGVAPTATIGMLLADGVVFLYSGDLNAIRFILASGAPALNITYYRNNG